MAEHHMKDSRTLIAELQNEIDRAISPHLEGVDEFALVDFPDHPNVGDSAIWLGEAIYLRQKLGRHPSYACTFDTWSKDEFLRAVPTGPIFFHGGGNFGDVWPNHHEFRLRLLSEFPDRRIIQLPQTMHFSSAENLKKAADIINSHGNFTIFVRDLPSLELAKKEFRAATFLCPDMAFCLGSQGRRVGVTRELLLLLRTDHERLERKLDVELPRFADLEDWLPERRGFGTWLFYKALIRTYSSFFLQGRVPSRIDTHVQWYNCLASYRVGRGLKQIASSAYIVTDRLHTHILCILLNLPHAVLDNNYGKISRFIEAWTKSFDGLHQPICVSLDDAVRTCSSGKDKP